TMKNNISKNIRAFVIPEPSKVSLEDFHNAIQDSGAIFCGGLIKERKSSQEWRRALSPTRVWFYKDLEHPNEELNTSPNVDIAEYESCLKWLMSDSRVYYLMERSYRTGVGKSVFNKTV